MLRYGFEFLLFLLSGWIAKFSESLSKFYSNWHVISTLFTSFCRNCSNVNIYRIWLRDAKCFITLCSYDGTMYFLLISIHIYFKDQSLQWWLVVGVNFLLSFFIVGENALLSFYSLILVFFLLLFIYNKLYRNNNSKYNNNNVCVIDCFEFFFLCFIIYDFLAICIQNDGIINVRKIIMNNNRHSTNVDQNLRNWEWDDTKVCIYMYIYK